MPTTTPTFWSGDILANTSTLGTQGGARIVALDGGGFAIAWRETNPEQDPNGDTSIRIQRFSADGQPLFGEIAINALGDQELAEIVARDGGGFSVLYTRDDGTLDAIARSYSSSGVPLLGGFTETDVRSNFACMTRLEGGQTVAIVDDGAGLVIKLMSPSGSLIGTFDVAATGDLDGFDPSVTALANGGFAVVWRDITQPNLQFRLFGADGSPASAQIEVPASVAQFTPEVIGLANGNFVITWHESSATGFDQSLASVHGRIYTPNGTSASTTFILNTTTPQSQFHQSITALADGGFFVVWQDNSATGGDTSFGSIRGQRFSSDGVRIGEEILINEITSGSQTSPEVALLGDGRIVVTWTDNSGENDPDSGIVFRILDPRDADIFGTNEDDVIYSRLGDSVVDGQDGNDMLFGMSGDDHLIGGAGNDVLDGGDGDDTLSGGSGNDTLAGGAGNNAINGGSGDDTITAGSGIDAIDAGSGNDTINGGANNDTLFGGLGMDRLSGGAGGDNLHGGEEGDRLLGGNGDDNLEGGDGADSLLGGTGADRLAGGADNDQYYLDTAADVVIETADQGIDSVFADFDYTLGANVEVLRLLAGTWNGTGNEHDNTLFGSAGANTLLGLGGDDRLFGEGGPDVLSGGAGNDRLFGGVGRDTMSGGSGADRFVFESTEDLGAAFASADILTDFNGAAGDRIHLVGIDAIAGTPEDDAFTFIGTGAFSGAAGELRYFSNQNGTFIEMDVDGDGTSDLFLRLEGQVDLSASDFFF